MPQGPVHSDLGQFGSEFSTVKDGDLESMHFPSCCTLPRATHWIEAYKWAATNFMSQKMEKMSHKSIYV